MKILVLGSGGREHALAWKLSQSKECSALFIAPGNAGTLEYGTNVQLKPTEFEAIQAFCIKEKIEMVVVGPEEPLVKGIVDSLRSQKSLQHIHIIGPAGMSAQLEGSKAFAKAFMIRQKIPTAAYGEFDERTYEQGIEFIQKHPLPIVLKADGLAAGKGVLICNDYAEAIAEFELMIQRNKFGEAGKKVVIEQFLDGIEVSVFALTDGRSYVLLPEAKDYKRIGNGDTGLNTGGMGAVSPVPFAGDAFMNKVEERIIRPTINGLAEEGLPYKGFIFFGLIKVGEDPFLIEYNCRLGDPETEVVLPRLKNDLVELFVATSLETLENIRIEIDDRSACTVVAVSGGYPADFKKGLEIQGLDEARNMNTLLFHSSTRKVDNKILTDGGRVLCVTSYGSSISGAVNSSKEVLQKIHFEDMYYRNDIGFEFV